MPGAGSGSAKIRRPVRSFVTLLPAAALIVLAFFFAVDSRPSEAQAVKPNPPENVTVTPGDGILVVTWDAPSSGPTPGTYWVDWGWEVRGVWKYAQINDYNHYTAPGQRTFTIANIPNGTRSFVDVKSGVPTSWSPSGPTVPPERLSAPARVDDVYPSADGSGAKSSVATLRGILTGVNTGELFRFTPAFSATTKEYSARVPEDTIWVEVRPFVTEMNASYSVTPKRPNPSNWTDLGPAGTSTVVTIVVTAHDGTTTDTYRLTVQRGDPPPPPEPQGSLEFSVVEGRRSDGSGGRFVSASSLTISEGLSFNYWIKLSARPASNVTVAPANSSSAVWVNTGSPNPLTFTTENWSSRQNVQVFTYPGAADDEAAGSIAHTVSSDDSAFNGVTASFSVTIVGANSSCSASAAPTLTVDDSNRWMSVSPSAASCGSTPIVGYDTAIKKDDGPWKFSSNTRWAVPSAATYSVNPVVNSHEVFSGSTYSVKTRGLTYDKGVSPWSPVTTTTVQGVKASDADLQGLYITPGQIEFDADTTEYTVNVAQSVTSVTVYVFTKDYRATATVDGAALGPALTAEISLTEGEDKDIPVVVTAEDGVTTKTYTVTVTTEDEGEQPAGQTGPGGL